MTAHQDDMDDLDTRPRETPAPFWTVAIYLRDKRFGGPEEGGWWYTCGERVDTPLEGMNPNSIITVFTGEGTRYRDKIDEHTGVFMTAAEQEAQAYVELMQTQLDATVNRGRRSIDSVLSEGMYYAEAHPGHPPAFYPETKPHYE